MPMVTDRPSRRAALGQSLALVSLVAGFGRSNVDAQTIASSSLGVWPDAPRVLTAWTAGGRDWAGVWQPGQPLRGAALPARAHQLLALPCSTQRPSLQALVLARRPGEYLLRIDALRGQALQWHGMEEDRYLGGHAALSSDGKTFFTTETDATSGRGLVVERNLHSLQALREFNSGGTGPHAVLQEVGGTLLVANGGILNLPETGRRKLNVDRMDSNLTRLDPTSGAILAQYRLDDPFLSLRHLAIAPDGKAAIALQAEHAKPVDRAAAPAWALLENQQLRAVHWRATADTPTGWDGYAGDICYANQRFWVSAPHAGWLASWTVAGDEPQLQQLTGAGALASRGDMWVAGGAQAALAQRPGSMGSSPVNANYTLLSAWDNHAELL